METGADQRLFPIDPEQAECLTPLIIDSPADCDQCTIEAVQLSTSNIHNSLAGLQGGQSGQYYHLTALQYQAVLNANSPTGNNPFATLADITNVDYAFSSGLTANGSNVTWGGPLTSDTDIDINGVFLTWSDNGNSAGMSYSADYSANGISLFGDRWIPDAGWVLANAGSFSFSNGLTDSGGGAIVLGGTLDNDTTVDADTHAFFIDGNDGGAITLVAKFSADFSQIYSHNTSTGGAGVLTVRSDTASLSSRSAAGNFAVFDTSDGILTLQTASPSLAAQSIIFNNSDLGINITDARNSLGLVYANNYASNGGSNPRWIPDAGWVQAQLTGAALTFSNGLVKSGSAVKLGGSLTQNTIINTAGHLFVLTDGGVTNTPFYTPALLWSKDFGFIVTDDDGAGTAASVSASIGSGFSATGHGLSDDYSFNVSLGGVTTNITHFVGSTPFTTGISVLNPLNPGGGGVPGIGVADAISNLGFTYEADYSGNGGSNPRWIPDNGYISGHYIPIVLTNDVTTVGQFYQLTFDHDSGGQRSFFSIQGSGIEMKTAPSGPSPTLYADFLFGYQDVLLKLNYGTMASYLDMLVVSSKPTLKLEIEDLGSTAVRGISFGGDSLAWVTVKDEIGLKGMVYGGDYSGAGLSDPRWIPDIGTISKSFVPYVRGGPRGSTFTTLGGTQTIGPGYTPSSDTLVRINYNCWVASYTSGNITLGANYTDMAGTVHTNQVLFTWTAAGCVVTTPAIVAVQGGSTLTITWTIGASNIIKPGYMFEPIFN